MSNQTQMESTLVYEAFSFERPIQLHVRLVLVLMTFFINDVVIYVLLQRRLRSLTNMILVAIAIADTLTGLVTLPTYLMVYTRSGSESEGNITDYYDYNYDYDYGEYNFSSLEERGYYNHLNHSVDGNIYDSYYILSEFLCKAFMIAEFYFSRVFHTISIWLTVYLAVQRYICLKLPFKSDKIFNTRHTLVAVVVIVIAAPILHVYHLVDDKTKNGYCSWRLEGDCTGSCAHLWATLIFRHLIPCTVLTATTAAFVHLLLSSRFNVGNDARTRENRRISIIVIVVVITFLIPEFPYGIFLLFSTIKGHLNLASIDSLQTNRAIHIAYEICLLLSFNVNFYVFVFMNRRFRLKLKELFSCESNRDAATSTKTKNGTLTKNAMEMNRLYKGQHNENE